MTSRFPNVADPEQMTNTLLSRHLHAAHIIRNMGPRPALNILRYLEQYKKRKVLKPEIVSARI